MRLRVIVALFIALSMPLHSRAGLYYSHEIVAELPSQWRGFLIDQRGLRTLARPSVPGIPPTSLNVDYRSASARLEKNGNPSADDLADLGAVYVRMGRADKAVELLRSAMRQHADHFRIAANLGTAWQLQGDLDQAANCLRIAVKLAPAKLRPAEELHLKLVQLRKKDGKDTSRLDDLFGIRFVGDKGEWVSGTIAESERKKLPADAVANLQRLGLALPGDARILWQLGEMANAHGDVRTAAAIFDGLVAEFAMTSPEVRHRRQVLRDLVEKLPPASRSDDSTHGGHQTLTFRSPRPLVRRFDVSQLPVPSADHANPLPWALLAETNMDAKSRPTFPDYVKKVDGKKVTLTGFMQQLGDENETSTFLLIEYPVGCWFCETPPPTGLLLVEMPEGKTAALHRLNQPFQCERFAEVIDHAQVFRVSLVAASLVRGHHDDRRGLFAAEMLQNRIAAHSRHHHVQNHQVRFVIVDHLLALMAVVRVDDSVALPFQHQAQPVDQFPVVVHNQNGFLVGHELFLQSARRDSSPTAYQTAKQGTILPPRLHFSSGRKKRRAISQGDATISLIRGVQFAEFCRQPFSQFGIGRGIRCGEGSAQKLIQVHFLEMRKLDPFGIAEPSARHECFARGTLGHRCNFGIGGKSSKQFAVRFRQGIAAILLVPHQHDPAVRLENAMKLG
jgi:hypothetical protein